MSKRARGAVSDSFGREVEGAFGFLVNEFGMSGPEFTTTLSMTASYVRDDLSYRVSLDDSAWSVATTVMLVIDEGRLIADLPFVVAAEKIAAVNHVPISAKTLYNLRTTLEAQSGYVRKLEQSFRERGFRAKEIEALLRKADAREWRK